MNKNTQLKQLYKITSVSATKIHIIFENQYLTSEYINYVEHYTYSITHIQQSGRMTSVLATKMHN